MIPLTGWIETRKLDFTRDADTVRYCVDCGLDLLVCDGRQPDSEGNVHFAEAGESEEVVHLPRHAVVFALDGGLNSSDRDSVKTFKSPRLVGRACPDKRLRD